MQEAIIIMDILRERKCNEFFFIQDEICHRQKRCFGLFKKKTRRNFAVEFLFHLDSERATQMHMYIIHFMEIPCKLLSS